VVKSEEAVSSVEVTVEGESIGALSPPFTIGRDPDCDVILPDSSVSRRHVKVSMSDTGLFVEDVGSSNGTWVDGRRISREIIPLGHPVIVGRVSVVMKETDAPADAPKPIAKPESVKGKDSRKETLAVDIPQGYFDPSKNAPAMRMFECPGCGRRLRCASTTRRVKCRTCEAIIRFEGEVPRLETPGGEAATSTKPERQTQPKLESLANSSASSTGSRTQGQQGPASTPVGGAPQPLAPALPIHERPSYWEFLLTTRVGNIVMWAEALGIFLFFIGVVASASRRMDLMLFGIAIHLTALIWGGIQWLAKGGGPTPEERIQMIDGWLSKGVIQAEEHRRLRNAILSKR
jgi:hypothetical protein